MSVVFQGCPKLLGHPQYDPRMNMGWEYSPGMDTALLPLSEYPCLRIPGFLGYSDDPGIIPGWTQLTPLSEYPGIPGILGRSQDHPGMDTALPPPPPPCLSIVGFLGYSDDPRIIPGWTQLTPPLSEYPGMFVVFQGCPKLLGHPQYDPRMNLGWEILPRDGHSSTPLV